MHAKNRPLSRLGQVPAEVPAEAVPAEVVPAEWQRRSGFKSPASRLAVACRGRLEPAACLVLFWLPNPGSQGGVLR